MVFVGQENAIQGPGMDRAGGLLCGLQVGLTSITPVAVRTAAARARSSQERECYLEQLV